jgi:hypothetical protein
MARDTVAQLVAAKRKPTEHLPASYYQDLPNTLKNACEAIDDLTGRETFLHGALPVLGHLMRNVWIPTANERMAPTLMVYVFKPSGGGKGMAALALRLLDATRERNERRMAEEERTHARALEAHDDEDEAPPPPPPKLHDVRLSMRTTTVTLTKRIARNGGRALLADTEADAARTTSREWGSVREIIKKGFHGETADLLFKEAGKVEVDLWLSVLLTSTSGQLKGFINSPEDGMFNRFIFHTFETESRWRDQRPTPGRLPLSEIISSHGEVLATMYDRLDRSTDINVQLTTRQWDQHAEEMAPLLAEAVAIDRNLEGYINRLGQMTIRTAAIFAVLRAYEIGQLHDGLVVDPQSWRAAMALMTVWWSNALAAYSLYSEDERPKDENEGQTERDAVQRMVGDWRIQDGTMPAEALERLRGSMHQWVREWVTTEKADRGRIGRMQLRHIRQMNNKVHAQFDEMPKTTDK